MKQKISPIGDVNQKWWGGLEWGGKQGEIGFRSMKARMFPKHAGMAVMATVMLAAAMLVGPPAQAENLREALDVLIKTHKKMLAANADVRAAEQQLEVTAGEWYPNLSIKANIGKETQQKPSGSDDTDQVPRNVDTTITQKLWDFGSANSAIRSARLALQQSHEARDSTRQSLLLDGISAYLRVVRAHKLIGFFAGSVENIKKQAELEDARVQRGSGLSTDVLQAKTELAGAESRLIQAQGDLRIAINRYRAVFGAPPADIEKMGDPRLPLELLPKDVDEAIAIAIRRNPQLKAAHTGAAVAREAVIKTRADKFLPTFDLTAEHNLKEDYSGTLGSQQETLIKVEANYSFNLGLTAINSLKASQQSHIASVNRFGDVRDVIEEQARNAWDNLQTYQANAQRLHNQADIAAEFLELARRERQLGNRSLIDVLSGETKLINASSDAASADTDVAVAVFTLLSVLDQLAPDIVN